MFLVKEFLEKARDDFKQKWDNPASVSFSFFCGWFFKKYILLVNTWMNTDIIIIGTVIRQHISCVFFFSLSLSPHSVEPKCWFLSSFLGHWLPIHLKLNLFGLLLLLLAPLSKHRSRNTDAIFHKFGLCSFPSVFSFFKKGKNEKTEQCKMTLSFSIYGKSTLQRRQHGLRLRLRRQKWGRTSSPHPYFIPSHSIQFVLVLFRT